VVVLLLVGVLSSQPPDSVPPSPTPAVIGVDLRAFPRLTVRVVLPVGPGRVFRPGGVSALSVVTSAGPARVTGVRTRGVGTVRHVLILEGGARLDRLTGVLSAVRAAARWGGSDSVVVVLPGDSVAPMVVGPLPADLALAAAQAAIPESTLTTPASLRRVAERWVARSGPVQMLVAAARPTGFVGAAFERLAARTAARGGEVIVTGGAARTPAVESVVAAGVDVAAAARRWSMTGPAANEGEVEVEAIVADTLEGGQSTVVVGPVGPIAGADSALRVSAPFLVLAPGRLTVGGAARGPSRPADGRPAAGLVIGVLAVLGALTAATVAATRRR